MLTLLPALLVIMGRWVFWPVRPTVRLRRPHARPASGPASARRIARAPRRTWVVTALVLAIASLGLFQLDANGPAEQGLVLRHPRLGRRRGGARQALPGRLGPARSS